MTRLVRVMIFVAALAGCKTADLQSCELSASTDGPDCTDGGLNGTSCAKDLDCLGIPTAPLCDMSKGTCVQCMEGKTTQCTGVAPHCDLVTETCAACVDDSDCGGTGVCLPTGSCADSAKIIHAIAEGGSQDMTVCGGSGAGAACDLDTALLVAKAGTGRSVIKLDDPSPAEYRPSTSNNFRADASLAIGLTIDARNALLHPNGDGPIFTINSAKGMTLIGGTIEQATGTDGVGIRCEDGAALTVRETTIQFNAEAGIETAGCTLAVTSANIHDNSRALGPALFAGVSVTKGAVYVSRTRIAFNRGGGVTANNATFVVVGNVFLGNGAATSLVGGLSVTTTIPGNQLDFNTFTNNQASAALAPGIQCAAPSVISARLGDIRTVLLPPPLTAQNNIVWDNAAGLSAQVAGTCLHAYSDVGPPSIIGNALLDGGNNISVDPTFVDPKTDLSLGILTPVRGKADPEAVLTGLAAVDMAGRSRSKPADLGAYQAPPLP